MEKSIFACILLCGSMLFGCGNKTGVDVNIPKTETVQDVQQNDRDKTVFVLECFFKNFKEDGYTVKYYMSEDAVMIGISSDDIVAIIKYALAYGETQQVKDTLEEITKVLHVGITEELEKEGLNYTVYLELEDENGNDYTGYNGTIYYDRLALGIY
ncbi:hypothetical protein GMB50_11750 [Turicibacter sanguinis]|uniref:hypothetical protein n=1 Tax=Turicibacter sanguinis TaxID=154288 RepID=UPI0012BB8DB0|nr:hypothetical protein [Turicibacter sanguinis]MDB8566249.1 hypothetical protein [Turicibacter sanguinis]MDB8568887.1 hypothetical protein [Turicibacter sanguinis]MDB8571750.1 hypothetical protein [Turicibacter sanguinis]MDB8580395.1 hypothetical protein [Turicibacter sanguinis]MTO10660.1 hypothetical protein [Turicibacter sanguinis]